MDHVQGFDRNQEILFPAKIDDYIEEENLDDMRKRVKENKDVVKKRNCMCEHPFGTIKRGFNQGYLLLKGLR